MSENVYAHDTGVAGESFPGGSNLFQRVMRMRDDDRERVRQRDHNSRDNAALREVSMSLFQTVRPNIVQSIRAFRPTELAREAQRLGQHFLYANCAAAQTRHEALDTIATAFLFPKHSGKNYDALYDSLTDLVHKVGPQPGFVAVLEALPTAPKFDKEARETLLDVFREAAEYWAEQDIPFRVFYSFA